MFLWKRFSASSPPAENSTTKATGFSSNQLGPWLRLIILRAKLQRLWLEWGAQTYLLQSEPTKQRLGGCPRTCNNSHTPHRSHDSTRNKTFCPSCSLVDSVLACGQSCFVSVDFVACALDVLASSLVISQLGNGFEYWYCFMTMLCMRVPSWWLNAKLRNWSQRMANLLSVDLHST